MLVSFEWLKDYVDIDVDEKTLATRYAMSGLNHESTEYIGGDAIIDLEVTSNRGDALGHIGVAREASVLLNKPLRIPAPVIGNEKSYSNKSAALVVRNEMPAGCDRYTARIVRGVKIGPSPDWLVKRLSAINVTPVNNIVDITNYVMMECGQPLHAFDAAKIRGGLIVVRPGKDKEKFQAIDHREYELNEQTVTIADAVGPIAVAGIMGGAESEISDQTVDVVVEAASFTPLYVRRTARRLKLHSPSSFRFERRVDPLTVDWASQRCCELIMQIAGGTLDETPLETSPVNHRPLQVELRRRQVDRVLGIEVPWDTTKAILIALGCKLVKEAHQSDSEVAAFEIPSHRGDLPREIDLIEEIARIYGYDKISETAIVPTFASAKRDKDVMVDRVRSVLVGAGINEVLTPSCVQDKTAKIATPWTTSDALKTITPMLEGASVLRQSLLPSLLQTRLANQSLHSLEASLFEIASIYLTADASASSVEEKQVVGFVTGQDYRQAKGIIEEIIVRSSPDAKVEWKAWSNDCVEEGSGLQVHLNGELLGWLGLVSSSITNKLKLQGKIGAAELDLNVLLRSLQVLPQLKPINPHPAIERDLNFVLPEEIQWYQLETVVSALRDPLLQRLDYKETYRDAKRDGTDKKRVLIALTLQSDSQTLTTDQADQSVQRVIDAIEKQSGGKLLAANG